MARTKIVATIGPASRDAETLRAMMEAGMNVARINFSHGDQRTHSETIRTIRQVAASIGKTVAILGDLQGPKLRFGAIEDGGIALEAGEQVIISANGAPNSIPLPHPELFEAMYPGARLAIGDGELSLTIVDVREDTATCIAQTAGWLGQKKGVSLPGTHLNIPAITEKDRRDLAFACDQELDYVALSFVTAAADVIALREMIKGYNVPIGIVAKIEKFEALAELEAIAAAADALMVARGDLGIDCPPQEVPIHQKRMIRICNQVGIPVITATQMLQSMVDRPLPTRAEASDVANAILDGTDAVMLSNETAMGKYPVEAVAMMKDIANITEENFPYDLWEQRRVDLVWSTDDVTDAISAAGVGIAQRMKCKAILTTTMSGYTARQIAKYRPRTRIIAVSPVTRTHRKLALVWGVESISVPRFGTTDEMIAETLAAVTKLGAQPGDRLVLTAGVPFGKAGATNLIQIHEVTLEDMQRI